MDAIESETIINTKYSYNARQLVDDSDFGKDRITQANVYTAWANKVNESLKQFDETLNNYPMIKQLISGKVVKLTDSYDSELSDMFSSWAEYVTLLNKTKKTVKKA